MARKIIPMPEAQYLGALEREVERLHGAVEATLAEAEGARDPLERADEALAWTGRGKGRGVHGIRRRRKT